MYHVVLVTLAVITLGLGWLLVHSSPSIVARILPAKLTFIIGSFVTMVCAFGGFMDAYFLQDAQQVMGSLIGIVVGVWFMLAPSSNNRGMASDEEMLKRVFAMLGLIFVVLLVTLYLPQNRAIAIANLTVLTGGFWLTTTYLRQTDRGR